MPEDVSTIAAKPRDEASSCPVPRFEVPGFMVPKSIAEVRELARMIALAEWAPDSYRDLDGNYVQQKIELAIMHGATVGLGPIAAVQSIAVIDGMPTIWGDGALSIVERSGLLEDMLEEYQSDPEEGLAAICTMRRRRRPTPIQNRFSMAMAEQAQLTRKEGPWQSYPQRMLKMRARSWSIRDGFADVLRGLHIREEVEDFIEIRALAPSLRNPARNQAPGEHGLSGMPRPRRTPLEPKNPIEPPPAVITEAETVIGAQADAADGPAASEAEAQEPVDGREGAALGAETTESAQPGTELAAAPLEESLALADAEGGFIEVNDAEALRSEFERLFFDKHLSPDQILGLWESNEAARAAIECRFGAEALNPAAERLAAVRAERGRPTAVGAAEPQQEAAAKPAGAAADSAIPARSGRRRRHRHAPAIDPDLLVAIDPGWGDQRVFRYYRACLATFQNNGAGEPPDIVRFRAANSAIETRLRQKLPGLMQQIDAFYPDSGS
jgi:hypothetical protein